MFAIAPVICFPKGRGGPQTHCTCGNVGSLREILPHVVGEMWGNNFSYTVPTPGIDVGTLYLQFFVRKWRLGTGRECFSSGYR